MSEFVQIMSEHAKANSIALKLSCPDNVPISIFGDPLRLKQILLNLTSNAVKFCNHGTVTIKVENISKATDKVMLRFSVEDTGRGIPADKLGIIFEKFTQLDDFSTKKYAGTGLGLAICKRLVERMGGHIGVNSVIGKGSVFWFEIGFMPDSGEFIDEASIGTLFKDKCVLVIDASVHNQRAMAACLAPLGIACNVVDTIPQALAHLAEHPEDYHLLFMDQSLLKNTEEIGHTLRTLRHAGRISIVLLTSSALNKIPSFIQKSDFDAYLAKPVSPSGLIDTMTNVLYAKKSPSNQMPPSQGIAAGRRLIERKFQGKVLLVEDYPPNRQMAKSMLTKMGCDVELASNGEEALEQLKTNQYDLVFMDCQMPEMDGFQTTGEIRKHDYGRQTIIIAMTANALQGDREKCLEAGMNDYISKPIRSEELDHVLTKYLAATVTD